MDGFIFTGIKYNQFKLINKLALNKGLDIQGDWHKDKDEMFAVFYYGHILPKEIYYLDIIPLSLPKAKNFNDFMKYILYN